MATIKEIKDKLSAVSSLTDPIWQTLASDSRIGVQRVLQQRKKAIQADLNEDLRLEKMLYYEKELYAHGYKALAGIDEVGRGPLAGPVVAAAVILPQNLKIKYLNDSKKIPKSKHQDIYQQIIKKSVAVGIGLIDNQVIDAINIYEATKLAMLQALENLQGQVTQPDYLLIDAMTLEIDIPQESIIKGDARSLSIAAASIVAKVTRDRIMADYAKEFPGYGFEQNAGYATQKHLKGLAERGVTPIHRKTFEPIKSLIKR